MPYRTHEGGACEAIVIPTAGARWWALALALPLPLTFHRGFMRSVAPTPQMPSGDDWCGNSQGWVAYHEAQAQQQRVDGTLFWLAIIGVIIALTSFARAKTIVVIDRGARVLRVVTPKLDRTFAFGDRPTLVAREGGYFLHAGALAPVAIASRSAPRRAIERLRAALERLLTTE